MNHRKKAYQLLSMVKVLHQRPILRAQTDAPAYKAASDPQANCGLCTHFVRATECNLYSFAADPDYVCNSFEERWPDIGQIKAFLEKAGARNSQMDLTMLQQVHDLTHRLGARCDCE